MAWTASALDANKVSATAADASLFIAQNILWSPATTPRWTVADTFAAGSQTDTSHPDYPALAAVGNFAYRGSRSRWSSGVTTYYYLCQAPASSTFDAIALRLNWTALGTTSLTIKRADDIAGTNSASLATHTAVTPPARLLFLSLGTGNESFTGSGFIQVALTSASTSIPPELGGLYVGARRVLNRRFERPYDEEPLEISAADFVARAANRQRIVQDGPAALFRGKYTAKDSGKYSLDDADTLRQIYVDCEYGTRPVIYVEEPSTASASAPDRFWYGYIPPSIRMQQIQGEAYMYDFAFDETKPYREPEVTG